MLHVDHVQVHPKGPRTVHLFCHRYELMGRENNITTWTRVPGKVEYLCCGCFCEKPLYQETSQKSISTTWPLFESFVTLRRFKDTIRQKMGEYCSNIYSHAIYFRVTSDYVDYEDVTRNRYLKFRGTHILREDDRLTLIDGTTTFPLQPHIKIYLNIRIDEV